MSRLQRLLIPGYLRGALRERLWPWPLLSVLAAIAAGVGTLAVDRNVDTTFGFSGGPLSARTLLSTLASAMLSFTGLVFSITIVALQLSSSQWSPRVMRTFLIDRSSKLALASFIATFVYAFTVLRGLRENFVPGVSVTVAITLLLISVGVFIHYIDHISHALRVSSIIGAVGDEGRDAIDRVAPTDAPADPGLPTENRTLWVLSNEDKPGVLLAIDEQGLVGWACGRDVVVMLAVPVGAFVPVGATLMEVRRGAHQDGAAGLDGEDPRALVQLGRERTTEQDAAFALRELADIAVRALSPGINDPTTAAQALDRLHDLLRMLGTRVLPSGRMADRSGRTRLVVPVLSWDDYVGLALDEVLDHGIGHRQVRERVRRLLDDLDGAVAPERRPSLAARRERLAAAG